MALEIPGVSYCTSATAQRKVASMVYLEATRDGLHLSISDGADWAEDVASLADVTLYPLAAAEVMRACWRYIEMEGLDPQAALNGTPGWNTMRPGGDEGAPAPHTGQEGPHSEARG